MTMKKTMKKTIKKTMKKTMKKKYKMKGGLQSNILPYSQVSSQVSSKAIYQYPGLKQIKSIKSLLPRITIGCPKGMINCTINNIRRQKEINRRVKAPPHHYKGIE